MADRFPLILNTSSNQIQELPSGDTLNLSGSGLNLTGITTLSASAQLNLGGTNINTGTRGDILFYNSSSKIQKLSLGSSGKVLKSNGTDLIYGDSGSTANVYYVSTSGTDASGRGGSVDTAYKTIKYACTNISTPTATNPAIIFVKAGTYEEVQLPIVVPAFTTIAGDSLRATIIKPGSGLDSGGSIQNNRSTLFKMSNATVLQDVVMDGMGGYTPGSPAYKPESATIGGVYLALNNASVISTKSPYIYNCTSFGNGATGAVLDGSVHASGNRSMLFHTYTAVHSDGLGIFLKANSNAELISTFTYYCQVGLAAIGGSKIRSLNSSNAYGEYGVYSAGFDAGESPNQGTVKGLMLTYVNVLTAEFTAGEQITGGSSGATAYVVNVQAEPKRMYVVSKSGTFSANETVTGGSSGTTATMAAASVETNQSGRILVTTFASSADAGDSLQFATTDGNAYQIQSVSSVTANSVAYHVLVFSTSRATPVAENVTVNVRKEFSLVRLTGHDFLQVGTGGTDTTNWPNNPTQTPAQADQVITNTTDPGRVYYTATDDLGNFYVGDQFKVDQATGNVTLDASAFNLSGLESLRLGSVGGLIGAAVGEFSTDVTLSQNSDTKVSTQKAVKTYVDTLDDITPVGGTFSIAGIGTVTGTTLFTKQLNVSGITTFHGNVNFLDGDRARFGSSEDLQIYHDSNNSYIAENGGGDLKIQASAGSIIIQRDNGHEMIKANVGDSVELYFNDAKKIETTNTGAVVTGILTATDFSGASGGAADFPNGLTGTTATLSGALSGTTASFTGNVSIGGTLTYEDVTNIDSVGIVTARDGLKVLAGGANVVGVVTATTFNGSGASLTNLNGSNIASGTVPVARIGTGTKSTSTFYRGDGTFATVTPPAITAINSATNNRIVTSDGGTTVTAESELTYSTYLSLIRSNSDTNFGDNSSPGSVNGIFISNSQSTNGVFSAITLSANDVNGTNQSGSLIAKSVSGGYVPEVHITQRTAGNTNESNLKITSARAVELRYQGNTKLETQTNGVTISGGAFINTASSITGTPYKYLYGYDGSDNSKGVTIQGNEGALEIVSSADGNHASSILLRNLNDGFAFINDHDTNKLTLRQFTATSDNFNAHGTGNGISGLKTLADFNESGSVDLFHNNTKMFSTESRGAIVQKAGGGATDFFVGSTDANGVRLVLDGDSNGDGTGNDYAYLQHNTSGHFVISADNPAGNAELIFCSGNSNSRAKFDSDGHFYPVTNDTYDLGTTGLRWRNIYTNDLNLSNEGNANNVDGTWGDFTIQEGESDLFLINNRSGKKYKFNLTEVS